MATDIYSRDATDWRSSKSSNTTAPGFDNATVWLNVWASGNLLPSPATETDFHSALTGWSASLTAMLVDVPATLPSSLKYVTKTTKLPQGGPANLAGSRRDKMLHHACPFLVSCAHRNVADRSAIRT